MKKLMVLFLAIGLITSMTACSSDEKETENSKKKPIEIDSEESEAIIIEELSGKTLAEVMEKGYDFNGYASMFGKTELYFQSEETVDGVDELVESVEGKTVAELVEEYDISIGYMGFNGQYTFTADIGSVSISFDLENGEKALQAHDDESFFDLEEADEVQNDKLQNVTVDYITLTGEMDDATTEKLSKLDDYDSETLEEMSDEIVLSMVYYTFE